MTDADRTADAPPVLDNPASDRFELSVDGDTAFLEYRRDGDTISLVHTEVPKAFRGRGYGELLVKGALDAARAEGLRVKAVCPFVRAYMDKHGIDPNG
jgi:predicted GNAT family acetyltransferase